MIIGLTHQQLVFFIILLIAVALLITEKLRQDLIAVVLIIVLYCTGLLDAKESLAGFSSEPAITVAGVFVLGAALHGTEPYVVTVATAAVVAFLTPIGHHGNMLIYGPGGYQFTDFLKVGTPLTVLCGAITATVSTLLW